MTKDDLPLGGEKLNEILQKMQEYYKETATEDENYEILAADLTTEIKAIGIEKTLTDRFGYLIFNIIFNENISKQIKPFSPLYKLLITKFTGDLRSLDTLMNLEYLYAQIKDEEIRKFAPTILKFMMEGNIIEEEFLESWAKQNPDVAKGMEGHFLFAPERDQ